MSVKKGTLSGYRASWNQWSAFINPQYSHLTSPTLHNVSLTIGVNLLIAFMSFLYHERSLRGAVVRKHITAIKQIMLFEGASVTFFTHPKLQQALKACRHSTQEIKTVLRNKVFSNQLPLSIDMIESIKDEYWRPDHGCPNTTQRYKCAIFLCLQLGMDTGRRIGSLTHKPSLASEDHCIRTEDLHFIIPGSSLTLPAGPAYRDYMMKHRPPFHSITRCNIYFYTQKTTSASHVILDKPIVVGRNTPLESELLDHLIMWTLINANDGGDELFTRRIGNGLKKVLLRKDVVDAIKYIAVKHSLNPKRFSSHSLRRGFATMTEYHGTAITNFMRAGWKPSSKVPQINYSRATFNGSYSYDSSLFTVVQVKELAVGSPGM